MTPAKPSPTSPRTCGTGRAASSSARRWRSSPTNGCWSRSRTAPDGTPCTATTAPSSTASPPACSPSTTGRWTPAASPGTTGTAPNSPGRAGLLRRAARHARPGRGDPAGLPGGDQLHPREHRVQARRPHVPAAELAAAAGPSGFQAVETGMTEGHPCFVANNGRLGFDIAEYRAYAPEAASPVRLIWLAAPRDRATFTCGAGLDYETLIRGELGEATLGRFAATLAEAGLTLDDVHLIPVHPWQWWNKLSVTFAAEIARRRLVCLGEGTTSTSRSSRSVPSSTPPTRPSTT
ncbi:IucA/IucC family protein [Streptomyces sp. M19]